LLPRRARPGPEIGRIGWDLHDHRARAVEVVRGSARKRASAQVGDEPLHEHGRPGRFLDVVDDRDRAVDPNDLLASGRSPLHTVWLLLRSERLLHDGRRGLLELNRDLAVERAPPGCHGGQTYDHEGNDDRSRSPQTRTSTHFPVTAHSPAKVALARLGDSTRTWHPQEEANA